MKQYLDALRYIVENGEDVSDRTGIGTRSVFGYQMRFNLQQGFPAVTTKRLAWKSCVGELLWFLEGSTDERRLAERTFESKKEEVQNKNTIWTANADKQGKELGYENNDLVKELGPVYGYQWRNWETFEQTGWKETGEPVMRLKSSIDQIANIIEQLKSNPDSRRIILSAWNVADLDKMALPPCHTLSQFRVINGKLSCQLYQRSADMFLGVPFNIASYSLLTHMLAQICGLEVGDFVWSGGDCHIYMNHIDQVNEQLTREPDVLPKLVMPEFDSLGTLLATGTSDYELINYNPMPSIKAPMAV